MKIAAVVILFTILAGLWLYQNYYGGSVALPSPELQVSPVETEIVKDAINVLNQRPGSAVIVSAVMLEQRGYVVIYDNNQGRPGLVLGNSRPLAEGESNFVQINLIRPVINGEVLFAVLHEESGDNIFSPTVDIAIKDGAGDIIFKRFNIDRYADLIENVIVN